MISLHAKTALLATTMLASIAVAKDPALLDRYQHDFGNLRAPVSAQWLSDGRFVIVESAPAGIRLVDWSIRVGAPSTSSEPSAAGMARTTPRSSSGAS